MSEAIQIGKVDRTVRYTPGSPAFYTLHGLTSKNPGGAKSNGPDVEKGKMSSSSKPWSPWGRRNMFPQEVMKDLRQSTVGKRVLSSRAKVHVGTELMPYKIEVDGKGKRTKIPLYIPEIEDFLEENEALMIQKALAEDLETYFHSWPYLQFAQNGSGKVAGYTYKKAAFCRFEKMNSNSKLIEASYFAYNWPNPKEGEFQRIPHFDRYNPTRFKNCFVPLRYTTPDSQVYYEVAIWNAVRENGWMEIDRLVPMLKQHIFKNQAILKYHVEIPYSYWEKKYGKTNWQKLSIKEQDAKIEQEMKRMDDFLSKVENSGKSFVSFFDIDKRTGKSFDGWKITAIDNKLKDDAYLPDASAAYNAILFAMGYDPTLIGANLVDKRSSGGSGSDKRESLENLRSSMPTDRYVTLKPLRIITKINGWNETYRDKLGEDGKIHWGYADIDSSQTLDENPTGRKNVLR